MAELVPLLFIALAVIVLLVLPMRQRNRAMQATRQLQATLGVGTEIMTTSGLYGTVAAIGEDTVDLEISPGVTVRWAKAAIAEVKSGAVAADPVTERADGVLLVNDAYNANPESMAAALRALASMAGGRRTIAVLGYMAELGDFERSSHERGRN